MLCSQPKMCPSNHLSGQQVYQPVNLPGGQSQREAGGRLDDVLPHPSARGGHTSDIPAGQASDIPAGQASDIPAGQASDIPAGQAADVAACQVSDIFPGQRQTYLKVRLQAYCIYCLLPSEVQE